MMAELSPIKSIETLSVALPTRRKHMWTGLTEPIGVYLLVKATAEDGSVGWGEAPALKDWGGDFGRYFGESRATTKLLIEKYLAPVAIGRNPVDIAGLHGAMDATIKGYPYAKAALEMAVYDLAGRQLGLPVALLLGGIARARVPVTHSIGLIGIDEAVAEAAKVAAEGIRTIKIKVGVDPRRDVEIVGAVRGAVGPDIALCVDANCGYATPGDAIRTVRKMERHDLLYVEQPVAGIARVAEVRRGIGVPVMADESCWGPPDVIEIVRQSAADIVSIYTTKPGGLYKGLAVAATAQAAGLVCNLNGSVETGVGNLANVHLAAAAPSVTMSCVVPVSTPEKELGDRIAGIYYRDDLLVHGLRFEAGAIVLPEGPGFGIDVDPEKIERYRIET
jgi:muconate cycloisomerase